MASRLTNIMLSCRSYLVSWHFNPYSYQENPQTRINSGVKIIVLLEDLHIGLRVRKRDENVARKTIRRRMFQFHDPLQLNYQETAASFSIPLNTSRVQSWKGVISSSQIRLKGMNTSQHSHIYMHTGDHAVFVLFRQRCIQ